MASSGENCPREQPIGKLLKDNSKNHHFFRERSTTISETVLLIILIKVPAQYQHHRKPLKVVTSAKYSKCLTIGDLEVQVERCFKKYFFCLLTGCVKPSNGVRPQLE
jgi:hypothetical protein